ncbi:MAG: hypothetical protein AAF533_11115 [Acidobacteriota bacterium]
MRWLRVVAAISLIVLLLPPLPAQLWTGEEPAACCGMACCVGASQCCCAARAPKKPTPPEPTTTDSWQVVDGFVRGCDEGCNASTAQGPQRESASLARAQAPPRSTGWSSFVFRTEDRCLVARDWLSRRPRGPPESHSITV